MSSLSFHSIHRGKKPSVGVYSFEMRDGHLITPFYPWVEEPRIPWWYRETYQPILDRLTRLPFQRLEVRSLYTRTGKVQFWNDFSFVLDSYDYPQYTVTGGYVLFVQHEHGLDVINGRIPGADRLMAPTEFIRYLKHVSGFVQRHYPK